MWAIILHGGAKEVSAEEEENNRKGCLRALMAGRSVLQSGGSAVEAVESAIRVLEDDKTFNAGFGSELNADGEVEMSSAIMDGARLDVGAVASIMGVRNPVSVARLMLREKPILMVGEGARRFAAEKGAELCRPDELIAPARSRRAADPESHDTVGCVALDLRGNFAVGTSTGGLAGSPAGRVGDSPQPGCGFYAENGTGAVAFSGDGEEIARMMLAGRVMRALGSEHPAQSVASAVARLEAIGGEAGAIAIDAEGRIGWSHSSREMPVALMSSAMAEPRFYLKRPQELEGRA